MARSLLPLVVLSLFVCQAHAAPGVVPDAGSASAEVHSDSAREGEAEDRRQRALRFYDTGNYGAARDEFERANQLFPSFRLLYNLGVVSMALGDSAAAYDYFQRYLSEGGAAVPEDVRGQVGGQLHDLSEHIATLLIRVDVANAQILVDATRVGVCPIGPVHVNAGTRRISARLDGSSHEPARTLEVHGGETQVVELHFLSPAKTSAPAGKPVFWAGWASTLSLAGVATVAGYEALSAQHAYQRRFEAVGPSRAELDRLNRRTTAWSITADALGAAAIAIGAYSLYVTLRAPSASHNALSAGQMTVQVNPNEAHLTVHF